MEIDSRLKTPPKRRSEIRLKIESEGKDQYYQSEAISQKLGKLGITNKSTGSPLKHIINENALRDSIKLESSMMTKGFRYEYVPTRISERPQQSRKMMEIFPQNESKSSMLHNPSESSMGKEPFSYFGESQKNKFDKAGSRNKRLDSLLQRNSPSLKEMKMTYDRPQMLSQFETNFRTDFENRLRPHENFPSAKIEERLKHKFDKLKFSNYDEFFGTKTREITPKVRPVEPPSISSQFEKKPSFKTNRMNDFESRLNQMLQLRKAPESEEIPKYEPFKGFDKPKPEETKDIFLKPFNEPLLATSIKMKSPKKSFLEKKEQFQKFVSRPESNMGGSPFKISTGIHYRQKSSAPTKEDRYAGIFQSKIQPKSIFEKEKNDATSILSKPYESSEFGKEFKRTTNENKPFKMEEPKSMFGGKSQPSLFSSNRSSAPSFLKPKLTTFESRLQTQMGSVNIKETPKKGDRAEEKDPYFPVSKESQGEKVEYEEWEKMDKSRITGHSPMKSFISQEGLKNSIKLNSMFDSEGIRLNLTPLTGRMPKKDIQLKYNSITPSKMPPTLLTTRNSMIEPQNQNQYFGGIKTARAAARPKTPFYERPKSTFDLMAPYSIRNKAPEEDFFKSMNLLRKNN